MTPHVPTSDSELEVLKALWEGGPATVRDLRRALNERGSAWAYTTVQTLLQRLERKGCVAVDRSDRAHVFAAAISKEELLRDQLDSLVERVCEGAATPLMLTLVRERRFSLEEIQRFKAMLAELEAQQERDERQGDGANEGTASGEGRDRGE